MKIAIPEEGERPLALRMAGVLWLTAALGTSLGLLIPGAVTRHWQIELAMATGMAVWGVICLLLDPRRVGPVTFHAPALLALPVVAVNIASTGGPQSHLGYDYFFLVTYCAYFYTFPQAILYTALCGLAMVSPVLYDAQAVHDGLLVQLFTAVPAYVVLGFVMGRAKIRLVGLRDAAHQLSLVDPLTGLPNRRAFAERIGLHVGGGRASDATGLMLVDLDDFKEINTLHGHPGGDLVLHHTALALRSAARAEDMVARIGGDEFAIVAHAVDAGAMGRLAERVLEAVRRAAVELGGRVPGVRVTASVGWALHPDTADTVDELIAIADHSLRGAKGGGKDGAVSAADWLGALSSA